MIGRPDKEDPKQEDPKQEDPNQEDPNQEDPNQEDPKPYNYDEPSGCSFRFSKTNLFKFMFKYF